LRAIQLPLGQCLSTSTAKHIYLLAGINGC